MRFGEGYGDNGSGYGEAAAGGDCGEAAEREEKRVCKARKQFEPLYEKALELGTFGVVPALSPEKAVELELDIIGTEKPTTIGAMKKRLQRAEELGVTKNTGNSKWKYIYPGTIGT